MYSRPERALVVKCTFDRWTKRISFSSARNCTFDLLRHKIEQCFSLYSTPYNITYKDDDGETYDIGTDIDLTEAIAYFHAGADDPPLSSAASILSGRSLSFGSKRITMRVQIAVEYDGPNLSDTSSLVSLEEYRNRNGSLGRVGSMGGGGSELSFGGVGAGYGTGRVDEYDDDSVTVSSRDAELSTMSSGGGQFSMSPDSLSLESSLTASSSLSDLKSQSQSYHKQAQNQHSDPTPLPTSSEHPYSNDHAYRASLDSSVQDPSGMLAELKLADASPSMAPTRECEAVLLNGSHASALVQD
jgi:hypothetical protein